MIVAARRGKALHMPRGTHRSFYNIACHLDTVMHVSNCALNRPELRRWSHGIEVQTPLPLFFVFVHPTLLRSLPHSLSPVSIHHLPPMFRRQCCACTSRTYGIVTDPITCKPHPAPLFARPSSPFFTCSQSAAFTISHAPSTSQIRM